VLSFKTAWAGDVDVSVLSVRGRVVHVQRYNQLQPGEHVFEWDPLMDLPSGVYFIRVTGGGACHVRRVVFLHP